MPMPPREQPFLDYRAAPSRATLTRLLEAEQHGVFNVCFHVLRHRADAEDAAQEVLVRAVDAASAVTDAEHWRRWLVRASVNAALDAVRGRKRRLALAEGRAAMEAERGGAGLGDDDREALGTALAALEEDDRALVVGHLLDRAALEELGRERGVSAPAVWKRLERAKERLRAALASAGCLAALPRLDAYLESAVPEAAVRDLTGGVVAAKVASVFGGATAVGLGGAAMTTKVWVATALVLAVILALGIPAVRRAQERNATTPNLPRGVQAPAGTRSIASDPRETIAGSRPEAATPPTGTTTAGGSTPAAPLDSRLIALISWMDEIRSEVFRLSKEMPALEARNQVWKKVDARSAEFRALREDALAHPAELLEFLKRPGADRDALVLVLLLTGGLETPGSVSELSLAEVSTLPPALVEGLMEMAHKGLPDSRVAAIRFLSSYLERPDSWDEQLLTLLEDADPRVQEAALAAMWTSDPLPAERFETLRRIAESGYDPARREGLDALAQMDSPEARDYLLRRLAEARDADHVEELATAIAGIAEKFTPEDQERLAASLRAAVPRSLTESSCLETARLALYLQPSESRGLILDLWRVCTEEELRRRLDAVARALEGGETRRNVLEALLQGR